MANYLTTVTEKKLRKKWTIDRLSEHRLAIERGRQREDRLCAHCPQNELDTELYFLTSCQMYNDIRDTYFPQITKTPK